MGNQRGPHAARRAGGQFTLRDRRQDAFPRLPSEAAYQAGTWCGELDERLGLEPIIVWHHATIAAAD